MKAIVIIGDEFFLNNATEEEPESEIIPPTPAVLPELRPHPSFTVNVYVTFTPGIGLTSTHNISALDATADMDWAGASSIVKDNSIS